MSTETIRLDDEELSAWRTVMNALTNLADTLDRELEERHSLGLADYEIFLELSQASDGSQRMTELARAVRLSPSGLTRRLDGLVRHGYIERKPCPSDGRGLLAVLTEQGRMKLEEMTPTHTEGVRRHFVDCVSRDRLKDVQSVFDAISEGTTPCDATDGNRVINTNTMDDVGSPTFAGSISAG